MIHIFLIRTRKNLMITSTSTMQEKCCTNNNWWVRFWVQYALIFKFSIFFSHTVLLTLSENPFCRLFHSVSCYPLFLSCYSRIKPFTIKSFLFIIFWDVYFLFLNKCLWSRLWYVLVSSFDGQMEEHGWGYYCAEWHHEKEMKTLTTQPTQLSANQLHSLRWR